MSWLGQWKDLLKIYALVFGAFIITFPANVIISLFIFDAGLGAVGLCVGLVPFIIGALILYLILKKKVTYTPYYGYGMPPPQYPPYHYQYHPPPPAYPYHYQQPPPQYTLYQQQPPTGAPPPPQTYGPPPGYQPYGQPPPHYMPPPGYAPAPQPLPPPPPPPQPYPQPYPYHLPPAQFAAPGEERGSIADKLHIPGVMPLLMILIVAIVVGTVALFFGMVILFVPCFIIAFSFPSLIWVSYVYSKDIYEPEPGRIVLIALTWGMLSTIPSMIFEAPFIFFPAWLLATLVAPPVEEFFKPLILPFLKVKIDNELDGLIYGVTAGMGFAMMENLFYEMSVFVMPSGVDAAAAWSILALARGLGSTIGHAVGAGIIGYAYGMYVNNKGSIFHIVGAFGIAVGLHMTWNGVLSFMESIDSAGIYVFIFIWPVFEFFILKALVDRAAEIDRHMWTGGGGGGGEGREGKVIAEPKEPELGAVAMSEESLTRPRGPERYRGPPPPIRPSQGRDDEVAFEEVELIE